MEYTMMRVWSKSYELLKQVAKRDRRTIISTFDIAIEGLSGGKNVKCPKKPSTGSTRSE